MSLTFYEKTSDEYTRLREFPGEITKQMPLLLSGKDESGDTIDVPRTLMTPRQLLHERLNNPNEHDREILRNHFGHVACAVIGDPGNTGESIIGLYTHPEVKMLIDGIGTSSELTSKGTVAVSRDQYQSIRSTGLIISPEAAESLQSSMFNEENLRARFWNFVTAGDEELVRDSLQLVREYTGMGETLSGGLGLMVPYIPGMRLLSIGSVENSYASSRSEGVLNDDSLRMWGIVPSESLEALV